MEDIIKIFTLNLGIVIEGIAGVLIAIAIGRSLWHMGLANAFKNTDKQEIRLKLGKSLALSLEFLLAADIVRTAVAPTWNDIGKLAAIAALRTLLNYFLERELKATDTK